MWMIKNLQTLAPVTLALAVALGGCSKDSSSQEGATGGDQPAAQAGQAGAKPAQAGAKPAGGASGKDSPAMAEARQIFGVRCAVCHGQDGRGNGPGSAALDPKPRDYSDMAWQKSVTDEEIKKVIVEGGPAVGKSVLMAPNPDLGQKPEVLDAMVKLIRSFGQE